MLLPGGGETIGDICQVINGKLVAVEAADRIMPSLPIDLGDVAKRTAGTDQTISHAQPADAIGLQSTSHMVAQPPQLLAGGRIVGKKFLAEAGARRTADWWLRPCGGWPKRVI